MSDDNHAATATIPARAAAGARTTTDALHAAAGRLQLTLDAISRSASGEACDPATPTAKQQDEALMDVYDWASDGWFEAPCSTLTDTWLRRLVDSTRLPMETAQAAAIVIAAREVHDTALATAVDDSESERDVALRRMILAALHMLGPEVLRDVCATVPSGHDVQRLLEIGCDAARTGDLARMIAALLIPMAGALSDAVARDTCRIGVWGRDPDELIASQRCAAHNVFCCPSCDARDHA